MVGVSLKAWKSGFRNWKPEEDSKPSRQHHWQDRLEYLEVSWRTEETYNRGIIETTQTTAYGKLP